MIYCLLPNLAWALFVFEPRCDSSISSLSTSHFLQCCSFSFGSIASAEVRQRNRSFIMHQTSSTMNSKVQALSKKPFQWHFQTAVHGPKTQLLFQAAVWFVNVLKVQNLLRFVFFKQPSSRWKYISNQNNQTFSKSFLELLEVLWSFYRLLGFNERTPQIRPRE